MQRNNMFKNTLRYLVHSLEVPIASVSRRANILDRRAEVREVVGQAEGGWQEAGDKHLTDLEEHQDRNLMFLSHMNLLQ